MTYREYLEFKRAFAAFLKREEIRDFSSADSEADTYFSWHPCDCCARQLGGDREDVIARHEPSGAILTYSVCVDCFYFNEYGRLDDSAMLDVEADRDANREAYRWHRQQHPNWPADKVVVAARHDREANTARYPLGTDYRPGGNWQTLESMPRHAFPHSRAYYVDNWPEGWRLAGRADEVARNNDRSRAIDHTGWCTDDDGDSGTLAGYVLRLPHGRFVPGTAHSEWDGVTIYPLDSFSDEMECARAADQYAERAAEDERDYQRAWRAGVNAAEADAESGSIRKEVLQICADLRTAKREIISARGYGPDIQTPVNRLCELARGKVRSLLAQLYRCREKRDELRDQFGSEPAFKEGFGQ